VQALAGAVEAVESLHERGVRMVINSNSPQNEETTLERLERLGFQRQWFVGAVTSGTLAAPLLASGTFGTSPHLQCARAKIRVRYALWVCSETRSCCRHCRCSYVWISSGQRLRARR
jgi:hypothetical protein